MKKLWNAPIVAIPWILALSGPVASDDSLLQAMCAGFGQVPPVSTAGTATFKARINGDGTITYKLKYSQLAGTGEVLFADVHFGQQQNTGGILFFLCANVATAPSQGVPPLPGPSPGTTVPGTVTVPPLTQKCPVGKGTPTGTIGSPILSVRRYKAFRWATFLRPWRPSGAARPIHRSTPGCSHPARFAARSR